jgi:hypothetical protein
VRRVRLPSAADVQDVLGLDGERDVAQAQRHEAAIGVGLEDREAVVLRTEPHPADSDLAGEVVGRVVDNGGHDAGSNGGPRSQLQGSGTGLPAT